MVNDPSPTGQDVQSRLQTEVVLTNVPKTMSLLSLQVRLKTAIILYRNEISCLTVAARLLGIWTHLSSGVGPRSQGRSRPLPFRGRRRGVSILLRPEEGRCHGGVHEGKAEGAGRLKAP